MNEIQEKMISMIDFDSFMEAVKVTSEIKEVNEKYVRQYLEEWAEAKEWLFVLFGEKLQLTKKVDIQLDDEVIQDKIDDLCRQYPQYAAMISHITAREYAENQIVKPHDKFMMQVFPKDYKKNSKPSRILSKIINDEQFDIDLSKILQNRTIKGNCTISIHPLDYVTLSTNTHNWRSCMSILQEDGGFNKVGGFSLMRDPNSTIAFLDHGTDAVYANDYGSLTWNNKVFRQIIYISKNKNGFAFGHYNGTTDDEVRAKWAEMLNSILGTKLIEKRGYDYAKQNGKFYYDTTIYYRYGEHQEYECGAKYMICVVSGEQFTSLHSHSHWMDNKKK